MNTVRAFFFTFLVFFFRPAQQVFAAELPYGKADSTAQSPCNVGLGTGAESVLVSQPIRRPLLIFAIDSHVKLSDFRRRYTQYEFMQGRRRGLRSVFPDIKILFFNFSPVPKEIFEDEKRILPVLDAGGEGLTTESLEAFRAQLADRFPRANYASTLEIISDGRSFIDSQVRQSVLLLQDRFEQINLVLIDEDDAELSAKKLDQWLPKIAIGTIPKNKSLKEAYALPFAH